MLNIIKSTNILFFILIFFFSNSVNAETITCGMKTITLNGNQITKIVHEDGTVHSGNSVSNNWSYDGKSISHRIMKDKINCGGKPKSREDVIKELSGKFSKDPKAYGMTPSEASMMGRYAANLMRSDNSCHLIVDAAKSTARKGMFYVDCNDQQANTKRYWVSSSELSEGKMKKAATPISDSSAISICNNELKARATNPNTYDPALLTGTSSRKIESTGRNVVEIDFKASNSFGVIGNYTGKCILESGLVIEVTVNNR